MMKRRWLWLILWVWAMSGTVEARAAQTLDLALIVGNNTHAQRPDKRLRHADDDAFMAAALFRHLFPDGRLWLLVTPDEDTLRDRGDALEYPRRPARAREWERAISEMQQAIVYARAAPGGPVFVRVFIHFSGHGEADGVIHFEERILLGSSFRTDLASLGADQVFALLDGCFLGSVVRGEHGEEVPPPIFLAQELRVPDRPPWLGVLSASSVTSESRSLRLGYLSLYSLTALRGPADLDGDERITFAEWAGYVEAVFRKLAPPTPLRVAAVPPLNDPRAVVVDLARSRLGGIRLAADFPSGHMWLKRKAGGEIVADFWHQAGRATTVRLEPGDYRLERIERRATEREPWLSIRISDWTVGRGVIVLGRMTRMEPVALRVEGERGVMPPSELREEFVSAEEYQALVESPFWSRLEVRMDAGTGLEGDGNPGRVARGGGPEMWGLGLAVADPAMGPRYQGEPDRYHPAGRIGATAKWRIGGANGWRTTIGPAIAYGLDVIPALDVSSRYRWAPAWRHELRLGGSIEAQWRGPMLGRELAAAIEATVSYTPGFVGTGLAVATDPTASGALQDEIRRQYVYPFNVATEVGFAIRVPVRGGWEVGPSISAEMMRFQVSSPASTSSDALPAYWIPQVTAGLSLQRRR